MTRVAWLGHATVEIQISGTRLLLDPLLGSGIGPVRRRAKPVDPDLMGIDAVLISHAHQDHLHLPTLRRLGRDIRVVVPRGSGRLVRSSGFTAVTELDVGGETTIGDVIIRAVPAAHDGRRLPFGPASPALGYLIDGEDRIYFAGDTDLFPGMADIAADIDLAILPVGGWGPTLRGGHLDPARAATALTLLRPRTAIAVHWGTLWPVGMGRVRRHRFEEPARRFIDEARRVAPAVVVPLLDPGDEIELPPRGAG
jgi:L-ascorbate metabolism protein UlaG (beta-lactamase superfamily)